jgi:hypothetical protein
MRPILPILPLAALLGALGGSTNPAPAAERSSPPPWCLPTADAQAAAMLKTLQRLGSATDSGWVATRATLGVPPTAVQDIEVLDDEALCERASRAVDSQVITGPPLNAAVHLARFGAFYAVYPPSLEVGEWSSISFFDSSFAFKKALAW